MGQKKTPKLTNAEVILSMAALETKMKTSPAIDSDPRWQKDLHNIIIKLGALIGVLSGVIDPTAEYPGEIALTENEWVEIYYSLDWATNEGCPKFKELGKQAAALMEKIGPDGKNMYC